MTETRSVVERLICEECGRCATDGALGWRGYLIDLDDDGSDEVGLFCPECVGREFLTRPERA